MERKKSREWFSEASKWLPGGVDSPVRAFKAVGGEPIHIEKASGAFLYDVDGNRFLDFIGSWGTAILGHSHPEVVEAVKEAAENGFSFGMPSPLETELAQLICSKVPGAGMVRFVNSGTEAAMTAIRLARAVTQRDRIVKFEGCYHGHSDGLLVKAGSGGATFGIPTSPGIPEDYTKNTLVLPYNDASALEVLKREETACVIVEPVAGNMGVIVPEKEYIESLRRLCSETGTLLIFDEVMSGFRVHEKGAQGYFGVEGDLVCLGKVIGGGLPVGAVAGKKEILSRLSPAGDVYQAGTLSGNPLAMASGLRTLQIYFRDGVMKKVSALGRLLEEGLSRIHEKRPDFSFSICGGMFTLFFSPEKPRNFSDVMKCDLEEFGRFFQHMLGRGILLPPSQFEANFISFAHTEAHIQEYLEGVESWFSSEK